MSCVSTISPSPTVRVGFWWLRAPLTTPKQLRQGTRRGFAKTISRFSTENQQLNHSVAMTWHSSFHWPSQPPNFWLSSGPTPLIMTISASNWEPSVKNSVKHNIDLLALLELIHLCLLHYIISDIIMNCYPKITSENERIQLAGWGESSILLQLLNKHYHTPHGIFRMCLLTFQPQLVSDGKTAWLILNRHELHE